MTNLNHDLATPMIQDTHSGRFGVKVLATVSFITGIGFVVLCSSGWVEQSQMVNEESPMAMAWHLRQPARAQQVRQVQPVKVGQFMQVAKPWMFPFRAQMLPAEVSRGQHLMPQAETGESAVMDTSAGVAEPAQDVNLESGTISRWNIKKGFGFIKTEADGDDLFCHISEVKHGKTNHHVGAVPHPGDKVKFTRKLDEARGQIQAAKVLLFPVSHIAVDQKVDHHEMLEMGTVASWNLKKGFGFIKPDIGGEDLFVHFTKLMGVERLMAGDTVAFTTELNEKSGKSEAVDVHYIRNPISSIREPELVKPDDSSNEAPTPAA
eukprot:gnl/MRDRNA2_/MRDRNA2_95596_c0_seq1.p1 gnl/MRDRNA2_/MRDRNA2_95596_c0~~gnl/MRDRNA2_/MRDRNA2_95596_c0_seq1.p1  ORF type:complete len:321 (-),score=67.90 gnl/MRDRNA2_/MRDRNA2_95596_c0_seq1:248-1210(-)